MPAETRAIVTGVFVAAALILAWYLSHTILIIFAGILIACVLDAAVRGLRSIVPAPRPLLLALVSLHSCRGAGSAVIGRGEPRP